MSTFSLQITKLSPPTVASPALSLNFLPAGPLLTPSTSLVFSFTNGNKEVFLPRIPYSNLLSNEDGSFSVQVEDVPRFREISDLDTSVDMYIWKGEKLVGEWPVGVYSGLRSQHRKFKQADC